MKTIRLCSYEEWKNAKLEDVERQLLQGSEIEDDTEITIECTRCDGSGEIEDEGVETGKVFDAECPHCDGDGEIEVERGELIAEMPESAFPYREYIRDVQSDILRLIEWLGWPYAPGVPESGFVLYSDISRRKPKGVKGVGLSAKDMIRCEYRGASLGKQGAASILIQ